MVFKLMFYEQLYIIVSMVEMISLLEISNLLAVKDVELDFKNSKARQVMQK